MSTVFYSYDNQVEQAFLWSIIFDNSILDKTKLQESDFEQLKNQLIFRMFNAFIKNWKEITPLLFKSFIEKKKLIEKIGYWYFAEIVESCEHSLFWKNYENIIFNNSKQKKIKKIQWWISEDNIYESIKELSIINIWDNKWTWVVDLTNSVWLLLDEYKKRWQMLGYKWPFPLLDKYIWWIISWKVYTIIAFSNVWKTSFSYNFVVNAIKQWKRVKVFSTEEQKNKVFLNIIKAYYWKSIKDFMNDYFIDMEDFKNLLVYDDIDNLEKRWCNIYWLYPEYKSKVRIYIW